MRIEAAGTIDGEPVRAVWLDGELTVTHPILRVAVDLAIERGDRYGYTPTGPFYTAGLDDPVQVVVTLQAALGGAAEVTVDDPSVLPDLDATPEDAR